MYNRWMNIKPLPSVRLPSLGRLSYDNDEVDRNPVMNISGESISLVDASSPTSSSASGDLCDIDQSDIDTSPKSLTLATPNVIDIKYMPTPSPKAQSDRGVGTGKSGERNKKGRHSSGRRSRSSGAPSSTPLSLPATFANPGTSHSHHGQGTWGPPLSVTVAPIKKIASDENPETLGLTECGKRQLRKSSSKPGLVATSSLFARKMKGMFGKPTSRSNCDGRGYSRFLEQNLMLPWEDPAEFSDIFCNATSSPAGPYTGSDLIGSYNNDSSNRLVAASGEELSVTNGGVTSHSRDAERPPRDLRRKAFSFNGRAAPVVEKERERDSRDRHKEEYVPTAPKPSNSNHGNNYLGSRGPGLKNNYLTGQQINPPNSSQQPQRTNTNSSGSLSRESEEQNLVAMGTNWNPSTNQSTQQRSSGGRSGPLSSMPPPLTTSFSNAMPPSFASTRKTGSRNNLFGPPTHTGGSLRQASREIEPKYADPFSGAHPSFQQRIAELAALEADTMRWEKAKKLKQRRKADS